MAYYSKCLLLLLGWWQICTMFCTFSLQLESCLIKLTLLSTVSLLLHPRNVSTCLYTVSDNVIIIQFIYKALGLNMSILHLCWACSEQALHNVWVPDGSQSVSTLGWLCHLFPLLSWCNNPRGMIVDLTCVVYTQQRIKMRISNMTVSTTSQITRDRSLSLMCNPWWCDLVMHCIAVMS